MTSRDRIQSTAFSVRAPHSLYGHLVGISFSLSHVCFSTCNILVLWTWSVIDSILGAVKSYKNAKDQREGPLESMKSKKRKVSLFLPKRVETVQ